MSNQNLGEIRCDEQGLVVAIAGGNSLSSSLRWHEVKGILAFKRDVYASDLICLAFETADGTVEVNEEMQGWPQLVERLPGLIPGAPSQSEWWEKVAKPSFAPCVTTLFKRN